MIGFNLLFHLAEIMHAFAGRWLLPCWYCTIVSSNSPKEF